LPTPKRIEFGRAIGEQGAVRLQRVLSDILEDGIRYMRKNCPVRTGRLKRSIHQDGARNIKNAPPIRLQSGQQPTQTLDGEIIMGGDTEYMQYVETYHFVVEQTARRMHRRLKRARSFTTVYRVKRGTKIIGTVNTRAFIPNRLIKIFFDDVAVYIEFPKILVPYVALRAKADGNTQQRKPRSSQSRTRRTRRRA